MAVDFAQLSRKELDRLIKEARVAKRDAVAREKARKEAERKALHDKVRPALLTAALEVTGVVEKRESPHSDFAGYTVSGVEIEIDGVTYRVSMSLTDVKRKKERKLQRELAAVQAVSDSEDSEDDDTEDADTEDTEDDDTDE